MTVRLYLKMWSVGLLMYSSVLTARETAPEWLRQAAARPVAVSTKEASAVVLLDEHALEVAPDGVRTSRWHVALRVLTNDGKKHAVARVPYTEGASEVKLLKAWLIRPSGETLLLSKRHFADAALFRNFPELNTQRRLQTLAGDKEAESGAVFGYEAVVVDRSVFSQFAGQLQRTIPVERQSVSLTLPPGWQVVAHWFNHAPIEPELRGTTRVWTIPPQPALTEEPLAPSKEALAATVAFDLRPPRSAPVRPNYMVFTRWQDLSRYFTPLYQAAAASDAAMAQTAAKQTAGASTLWEKLWALGRSVQQVNYISLQFDAANAGGMIPRPAAKVLQCGYGDCKDKSTLLMALLATQGIASYPLIVTVGRPALLYEGWPSPLQFNHCILAIRVDESVTSPAIVVHPELGRLLLFDPTDEFSPLGRLRDSKLARHGLLIAGDQGGLIELPVSPPDNHRVTRHVTARLDPFGNVAGTVRQTMSGHFASDARAEHARHNESDFRRQIERWLRATLPEAKATRLETQDAFADARFTLSADFESAGYGKSMRDQLLIFKPAMISRRDSTALRKTPPRQHPVLLEPTAFIETVEIQLPEGYAVDESVAPISLQTPFGHYRSKAVVTEGKFLFERSLDLQAAEIPAENYEQVRTFFDKILQGEQSPVVLRRL